MTRTSKDRKPYCEKIPVMDLVFRLCRLLDDKSIDSETYTLIIGQINAVKKGQEV